MRREFWTQSAAVIHDKKGEHGRSREREAGWREASGREASEKAVRGKEQREGTGGDRHRGKTASDRAGPAGAGREFQVKSLENAYGSLSFQVSEDKVSVTAGRKDSFREPVFDRARERLTLSRVSRDTIEGAEILVDSHKKEAGAMKFQDSLYQPPDRIFSRLKRAVSEFGQQTLGEMMPSQMERKVFRSLKAVVAAGRNLEEKNQDPAFFKRRVPASSPEPEETGTGEEIPEEIT